MKKEVFCDILGDIDEKYIENAQNNRKRIPNITKLSVAVLAAVIVLGLGALMLKSEPELPVDPYADLNVITLPEFFFAHGMEVLDAYNISEIINGNPWSDDAPLTDLPIYRNYLGYSEEMHKPIGASRDKMMEALLDAAERLGIKEEELKITDDGTPEEKRAEMLDKMGGYVPEGFFDLNMLYGENDDVQICVHADLEVDIRFKDPISLPEGYNYDHYSSLEDMADVAEYFGNTYTHILKMDRPRLDISGGDYNIHLERSFIIAFYDAGGDITDAIMNYNFKKVEFYGYENAIRGIRIYNTDISGVEGQYPIITPDEAKVVFAKGHYSSSVIGYDAKSENIKKIELVYRHADTDKYFIPYYRLLVEIAQKENGIKTYGAYYVPAIEGKWITNMPTYDGSFN